jgi:hypothetical protein
VTLPDFLVIGAGKSGTTSLAAYLDAHPDVFMAHQKEIRFFDRYWHEGVDWYAAKFAGAEGKRAVGEASPSYLQSPDAPARVAETLPGVRLIATLRDPIDRAFSGWTNMHLQERDPRSFADAVHDELAGRGTINGLTPSYLTGGRYRELLGAWAEANPTSPLHVEWFEDLRDAPQQMFTRVCEFLDIDASQVPRNVGRVYHASHRFRWEWWRVAMLRWRLWERLPYRLAYRISALNRERNEPDVMEPALRAELADYVRGPNAELAEWLGRPLHRDWTP